MQNQNPSEDEEQFAALTLVYLQFQLPLLAAREAARADLQCLKGFELVAAAA